jgi:hypothetical protein
MKRSSTKQALMIRNLRAVDDLLFTAEALLRQRLRRESPRTCAEDIDAEVIRWLQTRRGAEAGDGVGRLVPWPRSHETGSSRRSRRSPRT